MRAWIFRRRPFPARDVPGRRAGCAEHAARVRARKDAGFAGDLPLQGETNPTGRNTGGMRGETPMLEGGFHVRISGNNGHVTSIESEIEVTSET